MAERIAVRAEALVSFAIASMPMSPAAVGWRRHERARPVTPHWAVILAGGDGVRLRALTRRIAGDDRPKQFCALVTGDTLLTETRRRTALAVPPRRTLIVVNREHERFYAAQLADVRTRAVVAQPENRGTAPQSFTRC